MTEVKFAVVTADSAKTVWAYLPDNYVIVASINDPVTHGAEYLVGGVDKAGWTLDGYVLPRLASGNIAAQAVYGEQAVAFVREARS